MKSLWNYIKQQRNEKAFLTNILMHKNACFKTGTYAINSYERTIIKIGLGRGDKRELSFTIAHAMKSKEKRIVRIIKSILSTRVIRVRNNNQQFNGSAAIISSSNQSIKIIDFDELKIMTFFPDEITIMSNIRNRSILKNEGFPVLLPDIVDIEKLFLVETYFRHKFFRFEEPIFKLFDVYLTQNNQNGVRLVELSPSEKKMLKSCPWAHQFCYAELIDNLIQMSADEKYYQNNSAR